MDAKMIDNEDRREDRKHVHKKLAPNRRQRRLAAKGVGVFKTPGAWEYVNKGRPVRRPRHNSEES